MKVNCYDKTDVHSHGDFPESIARTHKKLYNTTAMYSLSEEIDTEQRALIHNFRAVVCTKYSEVNQKAGKPRLKRAYMVSFCLRVV